MILTARRPTYSALDKAAPQQLRTQASSTEPELALGTCSRFQEAGDMPFLITKSGIENLSYEQARRLPAPTRGVRCSPNETSENDRLRAFALTFPPGAAFSHLTAASLLGLPAPTCEIVHATAPTRAQRGRRRGMVWHAADIANATLCVQGLPCTDPMRTWLDLGAVLDLPILVAVTDCLLRRGMLEADQLSPPKRKRGAAALRNAARLADPRSLSPRESIIRVELHLAGVPAPELNFNVIIDRGWVACADLAWPEFRVIVEYDGKHHGSERQRHQDAMTRNELAAHGWQVRVLTDRHFRHLPATVQMIAETLIAQGWRPG